MSDITPIVTALASTSICGGITGIKRAYDVTPSNVTYPTPCVIFRIAEAEVHGLDGNPFEFQGVRETTHTIRALLLVSEQTDSADAERTARPFLNRFVTSIDRWKTLNNTANIHNAHVSRAKYGAISLRRGDPDYLGWEFEIKVLEIEPNVLYGTTGPSI